MSLYSVYRKHMHPGYDYLFRPSDNFVPVPQLTQGFITTKNAFFKITFQGGFWIQQKLLNQYVHIMVNDHLIIDGYVLPNNEQRINHGLGSSRHVVDTFGGFYYNSLLANGCTILTRVAMVYLPPGIYAFSVGVRSDWATGKVRGGTALYEITQFETERQYIGSFNLTHLP